MQRRIELKVVDGGQRQRQSGVTLIETLIAILIFAFGMLGIAGLVGAAIKYQTGNYARMSVTAGFDDLAERIRTNVAAANGYSAIMPGSTTAVVGTGYNYSATYASQATSSISDPSIDCLTTSCTQAQRASYDVIKWRQLLKASLPGGAGLISGTVTTGFTVTVMWFDKDAVQGSDAAFTDTPQSNQTCSSSDATNAAISRFCCPSAASAPAGVRCYNATLMP